MTEFFILQARNEYMNDSKASDSGMRAGEPGTAKLVNTGTKAMLDKGPNVSQLSFWLQFLLFLLFLPILENMARMVMDPVLIMVLMCVMPRPFEDDNDTFSSVHGKRKFRWRKYDTESTRLKAVAALQRTLQRTTKSKPKDARECEHSADVVARFIECRHISPADFAGSPCVSEMLCTLQKTCPHGAKVSKSGRFSLERVCAFLQSPVNMARYVSTRGQPSGGVVNLDLTCVDNAPSFKQTSTAKPRLGQPQEGESHRRSHLKMMKKLKAKLFRKRTRVQGRDPNEEDAYATPGGKNRLLLVACLLVVAVFSSAMLLAVPPQHHMMARDSSHTSMGKASTVTVNRSLERVKTSSLTDCSSACATMETGHTCTVGTETANTTTVAAQAANTPPVAHNPTSAACVYEGHSAPPPPLIPDWLFHGIMIIVCTMVLIKKRCGRYALLFCFVLHARLPTASAAPWTIVFGGCAFSGDSDGAPLARTGVCPTEAGMLDLQIKGITSIPAGAFDGLTACT